MFVDNIYDIGWQVKLHSRRIHCVPIFICITERHFYCSSSLRRTHIKFYCVLQVTLRAKLKECRGRLEVRDLTSDLILEGVRCRLAQMTGGALVSKVLNSLLTDLLRRERPRLAHELSAALKTLLNNELKNFNLGVSLQLLQTSDRLMRRGSLY